ncbi:MAG: hypothetical protein ACRD4R_15510 [Candidatus Acidiferrales bacterium]
MRKILLGLLLVSVIGTGVYLHRRKKEPVEIGYAANRNLTVWNTIAAVRQPVTTVVYGARLEVVRRFEDHVQVRTTNGAVGWINESNLLTSEFWDKTKQLEARTAAMPVEAVGHTAVLTNLHIAPGRSAPRIRQLGKMVPVEMFERQALDVPGAAPPQFDRAGSDEQVARVKKEDWWLVRAHLADKTTVSGWVLGRFVQLDLPEALYDYAGSADMHPVAWFELDRVADGNGNTKPQYLLVGTRGPEGQPCDFTMLRVYTWSKTKQQYETAYVESGVCGDLPVHVKHLSPDAAAFSFEDRSKGSAAQAEYRLEQTIVRRERTADADNGNRKRLHG